MKRIYFIILLIVLFYAAVTNPGKDDFLSYLAHKQIEKTDNILGKSIVNVLKKYADNIIDQEKEDLNDLVIRKNYILFSKYEIELPIMDKPMTYIGAMNTFVQLPSSNR